MSLDFPRIGIMEVAIDLASLHGDRKQSVQNFVGLMQFAPTAFVNNLRLTLENSLGLDTVTDDAAAFVHSPTDGLPSLL
ncbi:hypothetical protein D3C77_22800 [compost metagenome]|uniref:hypothetical protein n=1 Tax=Pseudomonas TaxID=286 RepID=UPI000F98FBE5|nr:MULTISPECIES: hypothetical protein [Pseudomonas]MCW2271696.1 hypothetical protein [Pseudomonas sp. JUb96]